MNWEVILKWLPRLSEGALLTLELVAIAVIAGLILALPMGIARASKHWYVRALPYGYIFFFRGTPLLVQLFLVYYGLAQFDAVRSSALWPYLRDPFWCTVLTMTLHTAAYIAEILRGALQAIPRGEIEADTAAWGDVVLWRSDAPASYHLAATLDDAADGVTLVTRGIDLFAATVPEIAADGFLLPRSALGDAALPSVMRKCVQAVVASTNPNDLL